MTAVNPNNNHSNQILAETRALAQLGSKEIDLNNQSINKDLSLEGKATGWQGRLLRLFGMGGGDQEGAEETAERVVAYWSAHKDQEGAKEHLQTALEGRKKLREAIKNKTGKSAEGHTLYHKKMDGALQKVLNMVAQGEQARPDNQGGPSLWARLTGRVQPSESECQEAIDYFAANPELFENAASKSAHLRRIDSKIVAGLAGDQETGEKVGSLLFKLQTVKGYVRLQPRMTPYPYYNTESQEYRQDFENPTDYTTKLFVRNLEGPDDTVELTVVHNVEQGNGSTWATVTENIRLVPESGGYRVLIENSDYAGEKSEQTFLGADGQPVIVRDLSSLEDKLIESRASGQMQSRMLLNECNIDLDPYLQPNEQLKRDLPSALEKMAAGRALSLVTKYRSSAQLDETMVKDIALRLEKRLRTEVSTSNPTEAIFLLHQNIGTLLRAEGEHFHILRESVLQDFLNVAEELPPIERYRL